MSQSETTGLVDRLRHSAELWADATGRTLAWIGRAVVNDGGFFTRLENQPKGTTTDTLEKFARFLVDLANWPEGHVLPDAVIGFAHTVGVSAGGPALSRGEGGESSPAAQDAQEQAA